MGYTERTTCFFLNLRKNCLNIQSSATLGSRKNKFIDSLYTEGNQHPKSFSHVAWLVAEPELSAFPLLHHHEKDLGLSWRTLENSKESAFSCHSSSGAPMMAPLANSQELSVIMAYNWQPPFISQSPCDIHYRKHRHQGRAGARIRRMLRRPLLSLAAFFSISNKLC